MTVVACKIPNGLTISGAGKSVTLVGWRQLSPSEMLEKHNRGEKQEPPPPGGYGFTEVADDLWDAWFKANAQSDMVLNGVIFGADNLAVAHVMARNNSRRGVKSGLRQVEPKALLVTMCQVSGRIFEPPKRSKTMERIQVSKSASSVTVACKLPNGLWMQIYKMVEKTIQTHTGFATVKEAMKVGEPIKLNGCALPFAAMPNFPVPSGYALTEVPADFWEQWSEQNKDSDALKNRVIFACEKRENAIDRAKEQHEEILLKGKFNPQTGAYDGRVVGVRSGLEAIDPRNPPSVGIPGLKITTVDRV
jgi:hypothetical protein